MVAQRPSGPNVSRIERRKERRGVGMVDPMYCLSCVEKVLKCSQQDCASDRENMVM